MNNEIKNKIKQDNQLPQRKSVRLGGYDYSSEGLYFITICCKNFKCLFGEIHDGELKLNNAGKEAEKCWLEIPNHYPQTKLHQFIIMPNHLHGIIEIVGANHHSPEKNHYSPEKNHHSPEKNHYSPEKNHYSPEKNHHSPEKNHHSTHTNNHSTATPNKNRPNGTSNTIGAMVRGFKIGVTKWMKQNTTISDVWQRSFYEHIIKTEKSHENIANYIIENPIHWPKDKFYVGANHYSPATNHHSTAKQMDKN